MTNTKARTKTFSQEIEEHTDRCYTYKELTFDTEGERNAYLHALHTTGDQSYIAEQENRRVQYLVALENIK